MPKSLQSVSPKPCKPRVMAQLGWVRQCHRLPKDNEMNNRASSATGTTAAVAVLQAQTIVVAWQSWFEMILPSIEHHRQSEEVACCMIFQATPPGPMCRLLYGSGFQAPCCFLDGKNRKITMQITPKTRSRIATLGWSTFVGVKPKYDGGRPVTSPGPLWERAALSCLVFLA